MKKIFSLLSLIIPIILLSETHIQPGNVNGIWTSENSPYIIEGEISIQTDDLLTIEPGVEVVFSNHYKFNVLGRLLAEGTETDSIIFTAQNTTTGWFGLRFSNTDSNEQDSSKVVYCRLEFGKADGTGFYENMGGAIFCYNSSDILIDKCLINKNTAEMGGGIFCYSSSPNIRNSAVCNNSADYGGGIECYFSSSPNLNNVLISNNSAIEGGGIFIRNSSNPILNNITLEQNNASYGGGLYCYDSSPQIIHSNIQNNTASHDGGGMQFSNNSGALLENLTVSGNVSQNNGGGIFCCGNSNITINNSIFTENRAIDYYSGFGGAISIWSSSPQLNDLTIIGNYGFGGGGLDISNNANPSLSNVLIKRNTASETGGGILLWESSADLSSVSIIENRTEWGNGGGIGGWYYDLTFDPVNLCNIYLNQCLNDEYIGNDLFGYENLIEVIVDTFTVFEPTEFHAYPLENFSFNIENQIFEPVNQDIWVSPQGSNDNSGLDIYHPLLSITRALQMIEGDSLNPVTIHLDNGYFSVSQTDEFLPLIAEEYVTIQGWGESYSRIDGENNYQILKCRDADNFTIRDVQLRNGYSDSYGGAIFCLNSDIEVKRVGFFNNQALCGAGIWCEDCSPKLINVTMYGNSAVGDGGGVFCDYYPANPVIVNSIFWNNTPDNVAFRSYGNEISVTVAYSDFENGIDSIDDNDNGTIYWQEGNIDEDPLFEHPESGSFWLTNNSSCIDAGTAYYEWFGETIVDYDEDEYLYDAPDMGALEWSDVGIEDEYENPYYFLWNYPNPFNTSTTIYFGTTNLHKETQIEIFNIKGQKIKSFNNLQIDKSPDQQIIWDGTDRNNKPVSSGIYFYRLQTDDHSKIRRMILLR